MTPINDKREISVSLDEAILGRALKALSFTRKPSASASRPFTFRGPMHLSSLRLLLLMATLPVQAQSPAPAAKVHAGPFEPSRNAMNDFEVAKQEARKSGRRILVDVGGNWCSWCRLLDKFFTEQSDVRDLRDKNFVLLLVNYSPENNNEKFLAQFPKIEGYPQFFVLDASGKLLHVQDTGQLEDGKGYSRTKMTAFLQAWSGK